MNLFWHIGANTSRQKDNTHLENKINTKSYQTQSTKNPKIYSVRLRNVQLHDMYLLEHLNLSLQICIRPKILDIVQDKRIIGQ